MEVLTDYRTITITFAHTLPHTQSDPDSQKKSDYDWWTKYYYAIGDERRTQREYVETGYDSLTVRTTCVTHSLSPLLQVYHTELEESFNRFTDLAQTFSLHRGKGSRDPEDTKGGGAVGYFKVSSHKSIIAFLSVGHKHTSRPM